VVEYLGMGDSREFGKSWFWTTSDGDNEFHTLPIAQITCNSSM
jgi:hypothetical protein